MVVVVVWVRASVETTFGGFEIVSNPVPNLTLEPKFVRVSIKENNNGVA